MKHQRRLRTQNSSMGIVQLLVAVLVLFGSHLYSPTVQALDSDSSALSLVAAAPLPTSSFAEGDLIFQQSQSRQSEALREATASTWTHMGVLVYEKKKWYVAEASAGVTLTPVQDFINRGRGKYFVIKRLKKSVASVDTVELRRQLNTMMGLPYDIYFEWADDAIYCSELVYKSYLRAMNIEIGNMQKLRELRLDGPAVQKLIDERITRTGRTMNLDEPLITPIAMMNSPLLDTVVENRGPEKKASF